MTASSLPTGVPPLTTLYYYLTAGCNLACRHCWLAPAYQAAGGTGGHLDLELFKLAVEEAIPLGLTHVKLTGGEPLLHPQFTQIIAFLKEKEITVNIETNGTLLTPDLAAYLKDHSTLTHISISLDGASPDTHDPFRGVQGSFHKAVSGLQALVSVGIRPQVIMSLHPGNFQEIESLVRQAEVWGAGSVKFNLIQPAGRGGLMKDREQVLGISELVELGHWIEGELQQRTAVALYYSWPIAFYGLKRLIDSSQDSCGIFNILGVLADGQIAMCGIGTQVDELCYGRLGQDRLLEIWNSHPAILALRASLLEEMDGLCSRCILRNRCRGHCVAENYYLSRRMTASYWFCQAAEEAGLFPTTRLVKDAGGRGAAGLLENAQIRV